MTIARRNLGLPDLPRSQLAAEWRFTDYGDQTLRDYSGGGRHMTLGANGSAAGDDPVWSAAGLTFVAASSQFCGNGSGVNVFAGTPLTIIAAIRATGTGARTIIGGAAASNGPQFRINASDKLELLKAGVASIGTSTSNYNNAWHVVATTYDGTTARFYRNGMPDGAGTSAQTMSVQSSYIGKRGATDFYSGEMAYLVAYDRALTQAEIAYASQNIARHVGLLPARLMIRPWVVAPAGGGTEYTDTGTATSIFVGSGADAATLLDAGTAISVLAGSGADAPEYTDTGSAVSIFAGSGADAPEYADTGTGALLGVGSGSDAPEYADTGTGLAALFGSGADIAILVDAGGGVLIAIGSGADNGPAPPVDLPYQGDTTIYDSSSPTGSITGGTVLPAETIYD